MLGNTSYHFTRSAAVHKCIFSQPRNRKNAFRLQMLQDVSALNSKSGQIPEQTRAPKGRGNGRNRMSAALKTEGMPWAVCWRMRGRFPWHRPGCLLQLWCFHSSSCCWLINEQVNQPPLKLHVMSSLMFQRKERMSQFRMWLLMDFEGPDLSDFSFLPEGRTMMLQLLRWTGCLLFSAPLAHRRIS